MADIILRVTPAELRSKAEQFRILISDIRDRFRTVEEISSKTRGYWLGDAGDQDRDGFSSFQDDISYTLGRLEEHPTDLLQMAGIYEQAEQSVTETNSELQTDLIV